MIEEQEAELISRCRQGDDKAFEKLVIKYQKPVYNLALRITHSSMLAEEVTQVTFIKVFEKLDSYRCEYPFFSWLYRIAMNEAINEARRGKYHDKLENHYLAAETASSFELADAIQDALMLLRPEDRALIVLRHFHHLGYPEIAYIINRSESHVKSQLFRARHALKQILIRMGISNEN